MTTATCSALLLAVVALTGCASLNAQPESAAGQVKQVLVCELKPDADRAAILAVANDMAKLPKVLDVAAGYDSIREMYPTTAPAEAGGGSKGDTVTFILTFPNGQALVDTMISGDYIMMRSRRIEPFCSNFKTYQATLQNYQVSTQYTEETEAATRARRAAALKQQNELRSQTK